MVEIEWSLRAEASANRITKYLLEKWSWREANNFQESVKKVLDFIAHDPKMYRKAGRPNTHEAVIIPHTVLFYEIKTDYVLLLTFWDTRQDPRQKPYNG